MNMIKNRNSRMRLLRNVDEASFEADEARLYLDTHPESTEAKAYFDRANDARKKAMQEFEQYYGGLLTDNIEAQTDGWTWISQPFPWDEEDN